MALCPRQFTTIAGEDACATTRGHRQGSALVNTVTWAAPGPAVNPPQWDVPGTQLCLYDHPATQCVSHNYATGHSSGRTLRVGSSGKEVGRRRTSSVVTDLPASHARPRCSCDAGTPAALAAASQKAGGEGSRNRGRMHHWRIAHGSAKEVDTHLQLLIHAGTLDTDRAALLSNSSTTTGL